MSIVFVFGCAAAPPTGQWFAVDRAPAGVPRLAHHDEAAPGRSDDARGIHGFCPPRLDVFVLADGREIAIGEPCSGSTEVFIRDRGAEQHTSTSFYGAGGKWRAYPLEGDRVLLVHESSETALLVVELGSGTVTSLRRPEALVRPRLLQVSVDGRRIYVSGGTVRGVVATGGCDGARPAGQGCDPYVIEAEHANHHAYELRLADRAATP